jgi:hypothetical protein
MTIARLPLRPLWKTSRAIKIVSEQKATLIGGSFLQNF